MREPLEGATKLIYEYVMSEWAMGRSATLGDITREFRLGARSSAQYHVDKLIRDGYLRRTDDAHRLLVPIGARVCMGCGAKLSTEPVRCTAGNVAP